MSVDLVQFGVLGPLQVRVGEAEPALGTPQQRAVLALLLINRNRPVAIETLIDTVWEGQPPTGARQTIHSYISDLRRRVGSAGVDRSFLARVPPGYRLAATDDQCDVARFLAGKKSGLIAAAAGQFDEASACLSAALGEWRGPVLDDVSGFAFAEEFARVQTEHKLGAQAALAEMEIACGRAEFVVSDLEGLTVDYPYREPLWAQLITAYYLIDRQSDALDAYHRLKTTLAEDLGVDPGPTVQMLYDNILHQRPLDVHRAAQSKAESTVMALSGTEGAVGARTAALRDASGHRHLLGGSAMRIGRSPDNDVVLSDVKVSRHHAAIVDSATMFAITDLGSANGVYVRGRRIHGSAVLMDGDAIRLGDQQFWFEFTSSGEIAD